MTDYYNYYRVHSTSGYSDRNVPENPAQNTWYAVNDALAPEGITIIPLMIELHGALLEHPVSARLG